MGSTHVTHANSTSLMDCAICLDQIRDKRTLQCLHSFCSECIDTAFKLKPACPLCNTYHGVYVGNQPEGAMTVTQSRVHLPGYEEHGSIIIFYDFPGGIQGPEHPNPGVCYDPTTRVAYLPDSKKGNKVLRLLEKAFQRRLIFTIGQSATTGRENVIIWNDIHHKTSMSGGPQWFGYPDEHYLDRVQMELRAKGVTEDDD